MQASPAISAADYTIEPRLRIIARIYRAPPSPLRTSAQHAPFRMCKNATQLQNSITTAAGNSRDPIVKVARRDDFVRAAARALERATQIDGILVTLRIPMPSAVTPSHARTIVD